MKFFIETYGCAANQADSILIESALRNMFELVGKFEDADIVIVLTCGVKGSSENKILQRLKEIKNSGKKIIVAGCLTKIITKTLEKMFPEYSLIGPDQIGNILEVVQKAAKGKRVVELGENRKISCESNVVHETQPIAIASGCLNNCAFCATRLAKGRLKSVPIKDVVKQIEFAVKHSAKKILLTATDVGAYGMDIKTSLPELLREIVKIEGNFKIRVGMMNPQYIKGFLDELVEVYKHPKIIKFIHIPVQSGSNAVLKSMNRTYNIGEFKSIISRFRQEIPGIIISTDIICGFPTETEKNFEETLNLIKWLKPEVINISKFYPRPGTAAKEMKQLSTKIVKERSKRLSEEYKKIKSKIGKV